MPRYATTDELAVRYRVSVETIRAWARQGKIPSLRVGRRPLLFDPDEVDRRMRARSAKVDLPRVGSDGDEDMTKE